MKALSKTWLALPIAVAALSFGGETPAEAAALVNVVLVNDNVLNNVANNLHINVSQIPISVVAPVSVAANVCGIQAAVLSLAAQGSRSTCTAKSTSTALNAIILKNITG
jgi:hypothetical protein